MENDKDVKVPVHLNKITETGVSFKYCFDLDGVTSSDKGIMEEDFNEIQGDYPRKGMLPAFCGIDTAEVVINRNDTIPASGYEVYLNVKFTICLN